MLSGLTQHQTELWGEFDLAQMILSPGSYGREFRFNLTASGNVLTLCLDVQRKCFSFPHMDPILTFP